MGHRERMPCAMPGRGWLSKLGCLKYVEAPAYFCIDYQKVDGIDI